MAVGPRLQARLGLDRAGFSRGLRGASGEASTFGRQIQGIGARLSAALGIGLGVGGLVQFSRQVRQTVRGIAEIGDEAKRSGMGVRAFQEWKFVAEQNRIGVDALVDGFKELSLRADEFITTGGGSGADAFKRLGFSADELKTKLKNPSDLMLEIIGRLKQLAPAARIRIMDEIFGGAGGEQFVQLIEQGEEGLRKTITAAHETGAVLEQEMIDKAAEIDRRYSELSTRMGYYFKLIAVNAASAGAEIAGIVEEAKKVEQLFQNPETASRILGADTVNALNATEGALAENLDAVIALTLEYEALSMSAGRLSPHLMVIAGHLDRVGQTSAAEALNEAAQAMDDLGGQMDRGEIAADDFKRQMEALLDRSEEALGSLSAIDRSKFSTVLAALADLRAGLEKTREKALEVRAAMPVDPASLPVAPSDGSSISPFVPTSDAPRVRPRSQGVNSFGDWQDTRSKPAGGGGGAREDDYQRAIAAIRERTAALTLEAVALVAAAKGGQAFGDAVEYARVRAELLNAAVRAGKAVTPELTAAVEALARAYVTAGSDAEEAADRLEAMKDAAERGADAVEGIFGAMLDGADSTRKAIANLLDEIAKVQFSKGMMMLLGQTSWGSSLISGIGGLLGGNARGTSNWRGGMTRVNELGGEVMNLPRGTQIIPHDISKRMADQAASGAGERVLRVEIDKSPYFDAVVREISDQSSASMAAQVNQALPDRMQQIMARPRVR